MRMRMRMHMHMHMRMRMCTVHREDGTPLRP
jgi:hypothetical protein